MSHWRVRFSGMVQGVGFRYTASKIANRLGIVGWVANRNDGTVEMLVAAERDIVDEMVSELREVFGENLREVDLCEEPAVESFERFEIRR